MKRYFLETSFIVSFLRGKKEAIKTLEKIEEELVSSFICLAELYEGIYRVKKQKEAERSIITFFSGLSEILALDIETAKNFGRIRATLKGAGKVIEDLDILIAASCIAHNCILVTYNPKHFERIKGLEILALPQKS